MDLFRCVVLTTLFTEAICGGLVISDDKSDWTTATQQCKLEVPDLIFSTDEITVDIAEEITEDVWVGYYQARTAFEYFGCALKDSIPFISTKADPVQCMSACGAYKIAGLFEKKCFCYDYDNIPDDAQTMFRYCNKVCSALKGTVCGGKDGRTKYISLYRSIRGDLGDRQGTDKLNCMHYDHSGFTWDDCSSSYKVLCGKETTDTSHWKHANMYGYLDKNKKFKLADTNDRKIRKRFCVNDPIATSSSTEISKVPTSTTFSFTYDNDTVALDTASSLSSTTTDKNNNANSTIHLAHKGGSSDVGVVVGVTLSIVVIVVVVGLILRKRGFQLPFLKKETQAPTASRIQNNKAKGISRPVKILQGTYHTENEEYAEIDLTTTIDNEPKNGVINDALELSDYAHDYFVLEKPEKEQYDSTKPRGQKSDPNTYNPYNTLSLEESSNYDHVGAGNAQAGKAGRKVTDSENTYNTTTLGNSYLMTSGGESNNADSIAEETEDTYDHTNVPRHQLGLRASENEYDAI